MGCGALEVGQRRFWKGFCECLASFDPKLVDSDAGARVQGRFDSAGKVKVFSGLHVGRVQEKCKMSWRADTNGENVGGGALEALELAQRQRLGKLEHTSHVLAASCEPIAGQAATQNGTGCRKSAKCQGALNKRRVVAWGGLT